MRSEKLQQGKEYFVVHYSLFTVCSFIFTSTSVRRKDDDLCTIVWYIKITNNPGSEQDLNSDQVHVAAMETNNVCPVDVHHLLQ